MADALYSLKAFERCLEQYEQCRLLAEKYVGVCAGESMEILFKIEKTLNALAMLEKIGSVEAELKGALVSQYLMQSDRSTSELTEKVNAQFEAELLEDLWSAALEKQEKQDIVEVQVKKLPWLEKLEELANNKEVAAIQLQLAVWCTGIIALALLIQGVQYLLTTDLRSNMQPELEMQQYYREASKTRTNSEVSAFQSTDGLEKLILKSNEAGTLVSGTNQVNGNIVFYDGTFLPRLLAVVYSNFMPTVVFHCRGCSIVGPSGTVFFDEHASDYELVKVMDRLAQKFDESLKTESGLPQAGSDSLKYKNPNTQQQQEVLLSADDEGAPNAQPANALSPAEEAGAGAIVLHVPAGNPQDFSLTGFYGKGQSFAAVRDNLGWKSIFPISAQSNAMSTKQSVFLMCEKEIDESTAFWQKNLLWVSSLFLVFFLTVGVTGKILFDQRRSRLRVEDSALVVRSRHG